MYLKEPLIDKAQEMLLLGQISAEKGIEFRIHQRHPSEKRPMALKDLASLARFLLV